MKKSAKKTKLRSTIDSDEVRQFNALASQWWDETGPMKPLHRINPVRMEYLRQQICNHFGRENTGFTPFQGLGIADIGCGGGLVTEPLCRLGAAVTGIDAGAENIRAAKAHARLQKLDIRYEAATAEKISAEERKFDVVTALEIVEHVSDPELFIEACCSLVKKNGLIILSTLNRTPKSYLLGIVAAEYVLRWVPTGTHDWKKFLKPSEMSSALEKNGFAAKDISGLVYNPLKRSFNMSKTDIDVNYFLTASRRA